MELQLVRAINAGLRSVLEEDRRALVIGEDVGALGGVFRVTEGLQKDFGDSRVIDAPLAEAGIMGTALGLALAGFRPIVEIQFNGFVFPAMNQLITQVAKMRTRTAGRVAVPMVIRMPYGGGIGSVEHHSESPEAYFLHTPGLRVVTPSNSHDGYWMIRQAVAALDPVVVLEPERHYWSRSEVHTELSPGEVTPLHRTAVAREGRDVTIITYGPSVPTALAAAAEAEGSGISVEVLDLRTLSPLDLDPVFASVRKTSRAVVLHESSVFLGPGAEVAAQIQQHCFYSLEAPVLRVAGPHIHYPVARIEEHYLPDVDQVLDAIEATMRG